MEDFIGGFGPEKRFRIFVGEVNILFDGGFQSLSGAMNTSFNLPFGEQGKPTFHQIEPGGTGGSKVEMKTRMFDQPSMDSRGLVGCVVVQNQMDLKFGGYIGFDSVEELAKL